MPRDLHEIAKEAADDVVSTAQCAGYEINARRVLFYRSDLGSLQDAIHNWLSDHMEPKP